MCGRCTLTLDITTLKAVINEKFTHIQLHLDDYRPSFNIAPGQSLTTVISDGKTFRVGQINWGLIPHWAKDPSIGYRLINARSESLSSKPTFRHLLEKKRCLILIDSFYEWDQKTKQPYRFQLKDSPIFSLAGLFSSWVDSKGKKHYTCTIITTSANACMAPHHPRMPVILSSEDEKKWLDSYSKDDLSILSLLKPYAGHHLIKYPVSTYVNSWKNNDKKCIQPI